MAFQRVAAKTLSQQDEERFERALARRTEGADHAYLEWKGTDYVVSGVDYEMLPSGQREKVYTLVRSDK